jgi:hypothetical protein
MEAMMSLTLFSRIIDCFKACRNGLSEAGEREMFEGMHGREKVPSFLGKV